MDHNLRIDESRFPGESPLVRFLSAFDELDPEICAAQFAEQGRLRYADGRDALGPSAILERLRDYFEKLHTATHTVRKEWHDGRDIWIGEVDVDFVLTDRSVLGPVSKVFILSSGSRGIEDLRVYAAVEAGFYETSLRHAADDARGMRVGGRWLPWL